MNYRTEILVGIVVPILSAWLSYTLAERAIRRKESNILYIQIELVKKELSENKDSLNSFITKYEERAKLRKELEFSNIYYRDILIKLLGKLIDIKKQYIWNNSEGLFTKPTIINTLKNQIESTDEKIKIEESKNYDYEYLDIKQKVKISKLKEKKENYINKYKISMDRNIYKEFLELQTYIENYMMENKLEKINSNEVNFKVFRYIYNNIKKFNDKKGKEKSDAVKLYNDLILSSMGSGTLKDDKLDQMFGKESREPDGIEKQIYDVYGKYYKLTTVDKFIAGYQLKILDQKWSENSRDMVLLSNSNLYILISTFYEKAKLFELNFIELKIKKTHETYDYCKTALEDIVDIIDKLETHQAKIEKWCK